MAQPNYTYAKTNNLKFQMLKLKKQVVKAYMAAQTCEEKYPNLSSNDISVVRKSVLEIKHCIDYLEKAFVSNIDEDEIDLEKVMEMVCVPSQNENVSSSDTPPPKKLCQLSLKSSNINDYKYSKEETCAGIGNQDMEIQ